MTAQRELAHEAWSEYLDAVSKELLHADVSIEIIEGAAPPMIEARKLALQAVAYDRRDDVFEVAVARGGPNLPSVLRHMVDHPERIVVDSWTLLAPMTIFVDGRDGVRRLEVDSGKARPASRLIDLHCHILPGLDDGARDLDDALGMARQALADGITAVCATPHIRHDHDVRITELRDRVGDMNAALSAAGIGLTILTGGEVASTALDGLTRAGDGSCSSRHPDCLTIDSRPVSCGCSTSGSAP